jgi:antitoxin MazE
MSAMTTTRIIKIGNSQGIRIPKVLLNQVNLGEEVQLTVQDDHLEIRPTRRPRAGWEARFRAMAEHGDDQLLDALPPSLTRWDEDEWEW